MHKKCLSIKEAAEFSGLSKWYLYKLSACGELPVLKVGTRVLVPIKDFVEYLESKRRIKIIEEDINDD